MLIKLKINKHLRIKQDLFWNFRHLEPYDYLETLKNISKDRNGKNLPNLKILEVVLVHCNVADNDFQKDSRALFIFAPNKLFEQLISMFTTQSNFLKTCETEFSYIEIWLSNQNNEPLEMLATVNATLIIN